MVTPHPQISGLTDWTPLARGGFATVWKARQVTLDRMVAVKIDQRTLDEEKEQRRFLREAGAAGRLSGHPGIVTVHDAGILWDDRPYLVMELCPGGSLTQWLNPRYRPSQRRVRDVGVRIADALAAAHARGVLHRDVKPANILIDSYDNVGLTDFGLAAIPEPGADLSVTMEALTPAYAPREVFYQQPPTEFGDVFSLAATMYALLSGKPPRWPAEANPSLPEILELQRQPIEPLPGVDSRLMDVIMGALADNPEDRPTAAQFREQLAGLDLSEVDEESRDQQARSARVGAAEELPGAPTTEKPRRNRTAVFVAVALIVLAVLTASAVVWMRSGNTANPGAQPSAATLPSVTDAGTNSTSTPTPDSSPAPTPPPSATQSATPKFPAGFRSCAKSFGKGADCVTTAECWRGYNQLYDIPAVGDLISCKRRHVYQTFIAGVPSQGIRLQSQLERDRLAQQLCTVETLNRLLVRGKAGRDWQIQKLPPPLYIADDPLFRCIVNDGGTRTKPLKLKSFE